MSVISEADAFLSTQGIARLKGDHFVLLDFNGEPLRAYQLPQSVGRSALWAGGQFLDDEKPRVAFLRTLHAKGSDFNRLAEEAAAILEASSVVGVEAHPVSSNTTEIPEPAFSIFPPLQAFQKPQFPWMHSNQKLMLPCKPQWTGEIAEHLARIDQLFKDLRQDKFGFAEELRDLLVYIVSIYRSIFTAWGIVAQFGLWLNHPVVRRRLLGLTERVLLILGVAHTYEYYLFKDFFGLDVVEMTVDEPRENAEERDSLKYSKRHIEDGRIPLFDLRAMHMRGV